MKAIVHGIRALQKGIALANAKTWRATATAVAATSAFLSAATSFAVAQGWLSEQIDPQVVMEVSSLLVALVFTGLGYLGVATDAEQGVAPKASKSNAFLDEG